MDSVSLSPSGLFDDESNSQIALLPLLDDRSRMVSTARGDDNYFFQYKIIRLFLVENGLDQLANVFFFIISTDPDRIINCGFCFYHFLALTMILKPLN